MLTANTQSSDDQTKIWYLDLGCNNHITGNKNWFIMLDESIKKVIRFADGRHVTLEGKGNINVAGKDDQKTTIFDVLYVPSLTSNLISMVQLVAKDYNMNMTDNQMKVYNGEERLILRAPLANNKIFKIEINVFGHQCLASTSTVRENNRWLWHHK